jgi:phosphinothricin acetyltransferase
VLDKGFPYLVAEDGGGALGYAYVSVYRPRSAYRFTVENSVYVRHDAVGRGIGRALLAALIARCERLEIHQIVAVIGDSANHASIGLHAALGFEQVGLLPEVGFKFGRWVDSVLMQRAMPARG